MEILFILAVAFLAFANGANDNFKGMATLWGSDTLSYRTSLIIANAMTLLGAGLAVFLGGELVKTFSGNGMISPDILANERFGIAFASGAALTVFAATCLRFPISTTHSILGALTGAGVFFLGGDVAFAPLLGKAFLPLLLSPLLAVSGTFVLWRSRARFAGIGARLPDLRITLANRFLDLEDMAHVASGSVVCLARGVNDTPKIASIALLGHIFVRDTRVVFLGLGLFMVIGGLLMSRRIAQVMSRDITSMSHAEGFTGNFVTALLVLFASKFGLGVSTTHVSVGSLIGIGMVNGRAQYRKIGEIVLSWLLTLPVAFLFAYGVAFTIGGE